MPDVSSLARSHGDCDPLTGEPAREAILAVVAAIPPGSVLSYGEVAERAGLPRRARLVARILSQLPDGSGIPWHRVVRAGGCIAFASGSKNFVRQRALLAAEGCKVAASGRVSGRPLPGRTLDEQLWGMFPDP